MCRQGEELPPKAFPNHLPPPQAEQQQPPTQHQDSGGCPLNCGCNQTPCPCGDSRCNLCPEKENLPVPTDSVHSEQQEAQDKKSDVKVERKQSRSSRSERVKFPGENVDETDRCSRRKKYSSSTATVSSLLNATEISSNTSYEETDETYLDHKCSKPLHPTAEFCPWSEDTLQACCQWILHEASLLHPGLPSSSGRTHTISKKSSTTITNEICTCMQQQQEILPTSSSPMRTSTSERRQISSQLSTEVGQSYSFPTLPYSTVSTRTPASEKFLPLLENIYEVLQGIRQDQLNLRPSAPAPAVGSLESAKQTEAEDTSIDLPPPPPPLAPQSPSVGQHIHIASTPPLNIFITPMPSQQMNPAPYYEVIEQPITRKPNRPTATNEWVETPRYIHEIHGLEVMEPPVRDIDVQPEQTTEVKTRRLIPVDMDLLRIDDDFDWKPHKSCEQSVFTEEDCFSPEPSCISKPGLSKEIQVSAEDFPCVTKKTEPKCVSFQREPGVSKEVQVNENCLKEEVTPFGAQFLQFPTDQCIQVEEACKKRVLTTTLLDKPRYSSDSVSNESITCIETYPQEFVPEKPIDCSEILKPEHSPPKKLPSEDDKDEQNLKTSEEIPKPPECTCADPMNCCKTCPRRMEKVPSAQILTFDDQMESCCSEETGTLSPEMSCEVVSSHDLQEQVPPVAVQNLSTEKSVTTSDVGTDRPEFCNEDASRSCCSNCGQLNPIQSAPSDFVDSILCDLEVMKQCRENRRRTIPTPRPQVESYTKTKWEKPQTDISYPITIDTVQELGTNSLFIRWKVHNVNNITGYEIYLDGTLTNRYFSVIHRAAVICQVDLNYPHRIILRAQSLALTKTPRSARAERALSARNPAGCCPQPDGSIWYPSVYHYEPKINTAPAIIEYEESCANKC